MYKNAKHRNLATLAHPTGLKKVLQILQPIPQFNITCISNVVAVDVAHSLWQSLHLWALTPDHLNTVRRQVRDTLSNPHATALPRLFSQSLHTCQ